MPKPRPKPSGDSPAIDHCVSVVSSIMHMPDCSPLMAAMGCIAANYMSGPPVWLMLISPPSSGKTKFINSCRRLPFCREAGQCKNSAAFLTYDKEFGMGGILSDSRLNKDGDEVGGIGPFGILLYTEFSVILGLQPDQRDEVISIHRQIFDGRCSRQYGAGGGRKLEWEGKCGALGAVTGAIDDNPLSGDLGERWVYYRFPPSDTKSQAMSVLQNLGMDPTEHNAQLEAAVQRVFTEAKIERGELPRELKEYERVRIANLVDLSCSLRGSIRRDRYTREIIASPQTEGAGRLTNELAALYLGLERIGLREKWCWKLVFKVGFDCAPALRMEVIKAMIDTREAHEDVTSRNVTGRLKVSRKTGDRYLEDLEKLGVVYRVRGMSEEGAVWVPGELLTQMLKKREEFEH